MQPEEVHITNLFGEEITFPGSEICVEEENDKDLEDTSMKGHANQISFDFRSRSEKRELL